MNRPTASTTSRSTWPGRIRRGDRGDVAVHEPRRLPGEAAADGLLGHPPRPPRRHLPGHHPPPQRAGAGAPAPPHAPRTASPPPDPTPPPPRTPRPHTRSPTAPRDPRSAPPDRCRTHPAGRSTPHHRGARPRGGPPSPPPTRAAAPRPGQPLRRSSRAAASNPDAVSGTLLAVLVAVLVIGPLKHRPLTLPGAQNPYSTRRSGNRRPAHGPGVSRLGPGGLRTSTSADATARRASVTTRTAAPGGRGASGEASKLRPFARQRPGAVRSRARRAQTTLSGSSCWPVGPTWISVPISGHTPQS